MGDLGAVGRQRLVVIGERGLRVEGGVELVAPAGFEARLAEGIVAALRARGFDAKRAGG